MLGIHMRWLFTEIRRAAKQSMDRHVGQSPSGPNGANDRTKINFSANPVNQAPPCSTDEIGLLTLVMVAKELSKE